MAVFSMAGGNPALPTYPLQRSVRLRSSASAYFNRTPATATNQRTWTWSNWIKRGALGTEQQIFEGGVFSGSTEQLRIFFNSTDNIEFSEFSSAAYQFRYITTQVFRDSSAWYHIVAVLDTTDATSTNRVKLYINGVQITSFSTSTAPSLNFQGKVNSVVAHDIGRRNGTGTPYLDGYLTEVNFIDGQALTPSSFGAYNSYGVWSPAKYTGTYGTNGFYLNFQDNSALTTTANAGIGKDSSGNGNYWTSNNISITAGTTYDSMLDVPTNTSNTNANFCVMNPLNLPRGGTMSNGNLLWTSPFAEAQAVGTMYVSSGKWYWEMIENVAGGCGFGIAKDTTNINSATATTGAYTYYTNGNKYDANTGSAYGATFTNGDLIGIALDLDAGTLTFYKNNVSQGIAFTGLSGNFTALIIDGTSGATPTFDANFGQRPFSYTPPTGFNRLNTYNLPDSIVPVGAQYMAATLYTGNSSTQTITNTVNGVSMQPDFVWTKGRSQIRNNTLYDSVRGATKQLYSNSTNAELTVVASLTSFNSNGFSLGSDSESNWSSSTYVGWQWRASNASAVTNTAGTITSQVSANQTAGFSIVTYTGTGANATVGHGLGVAPKMLIVKHRSGGGLSTQDWDVYHSNLTSAAYRLILNTSAAQVSAPQAWNSTAPTSTVFSISTGTDVNGSGAAYVAYCFAEVPGYSKISSYTANGSADGPFVYCGFRPRFILVKDASSGSGNWDILDTSRSPYNLATARLMANQSAAEDTGLSVDVLSNGFKVRVASSDWGVTNGNTVIFAAFAENPFKNALAR